jgi:hypothetical protein
MINDELKIIGYKINVDNSNEFIVENICNYNHYNSIQYNILKFPEL